MGRRSRSEAGETSVVGEEGQRTKTESVPIPPCRQSELAPSRVQYMSAGAGVLVLFGWGRYRSRRMGEEGQGRGELELRAQPSTSPIWPLARPSRPSTLVIHIK